MQTRQIELSVNDAPIEVDYFVQGYIDHVMAGIVASLKGTGEIRRLQVSMENDNVAMRLNGRSVPINPFVNKIIRNTVVGMVSALKGVGEISKLNISIAR